LNFDPMIRPLFGATSAIPVAHFVNTWADATATVAAVLASNATARLPPASRSATIPEPITVAANSIDPRPSATSAPRNTLDGLRSGIALPNGTQLRLQRHAIERVDRQTREEFDSSFKLFQSLAEGKRLVGISAFNRRGVCNSQCAVIGFPGQTGQTSPAALSHTVKIKSIGGAPGAANSSQLLLRKPSAGRFMRQRMHLTFGKASGTESVELALTPMIQKRLGEDAPCRVASAQEQDVIGLVPGHFAQQAAAG
jgi:hypothetical protein